MKRWSLSRLVAVGAAGVTLLSFGEAKAADCPAFTNPVYVTGSSASQPVLKAISGLLAAQATPVTLIYVKTESCQGVNTFTSATAVPAGATYWPGGTQTSCNLTTPPVADASVADVFASTCGVTLTASQKEVQGPIQAMTFVVHPQSTETSMSAEAARVLLKYVGTAQYPIAPWTDVNNVFIRPGGSSGSGTRAMIGTAVGLADGDWKGTVKAGSGDVLAAVAGAQAAANASLGILSVTLADANRVNSASTTPVKELAFQAKGQSCGYLPDSTSSSHDKLNVREGRYGIWGPLHFITAVNGQGQAVSSANPGTGDAALQALITAVTMPSGTALTAPQKQAIIDATAAGWVIPQCAMKVRRTAEVGPEASFQPDEPCGCYWESKINGAAPASCNACPGGDGDCAGKAGTPKCRYGYCEAQ
jgi:hypothetical protein